MSEPNQRRPPRRKGAVSRYDLVGAREPAGGRALPPRSPGLITGIVAVPDPNPDPYRSKNERVLATVNRRVDILELERSAGRLSEAAYSVGRIVQAVFERVRGVRSSPGWRDDRVDAAWMNEAAIVYALDNARKVQAYKERIRSAVGMIDARLLEQVLGERLSYAECAAARGRAGARGIAYYAARFRDALEALADVWAAKGRA